MKPPAHKQPERALTLEEAIIRDEIKTQREVDHLKYILDKEEYQRKEENEEKSLY